MAQVINTNIASLNAQRNLTRSQGMLATSLERLSSGLRINSAKDDAAGLAISERFTAQIRGLTQAARNASDGISLAQTAEGALGELTNNLQRIRELAVQSANATNSASDRTALQAEVTQLFEEVNRVAGQSNFNGVNLLDGSFSAQTFQVGANVGETINVSEIVDATSIGLGLTQQVATVDDATSIVGASATDALDASGELTINGVDVFDNAGANVAKDAKALAAAIAGVTSALTDNAITATATNSVTITGIDTDAAGTGDTTFTFTSSDGVDTVDIVVSDVFTTAQLDAAFLDQEAALNAIGITLNSDAADYGIVAGGGIVLTETDGANINIATADDAGVTTAAILDVENADGTADTVGAGVDSGDTDFFGIINEITSTGADLVIAGTEAANLGLTAATTATEDVDGTVTSVQDSEALITSIDAALDLVNGARGTLGAVQNRFESVVTSLQTASESLSAARSRIQDTDFAAETASLTKAQILQQAGIAMIAQANALPQNVLTLLQ